MEVYVHEPFPQTWIVSLFLGVFSILVVANQIYPYGFKRFCSLLFHQIYLNEKPESIAEKRLFRVLLLFQVISFSFIVLCVSFFTFPIEVALSFEMYIKVLITYILLKLTTVLITWSIGSLLGRHKQTQKYLFQKESTLSYVSFLVFPVTILMYLHQLFFSFFGHVLPILLCFVLFISKVLLVSKNYYIFFKNGFYFILYICTLELVPLMVVYQFFSEYIF